MICITIQRKPSRTIESFFIEGHANYAPYGEDIVCAGVSSIAIGTVNAIQKLTSIRLISEVKDGYLQVVIPAIEQPAIEAKVQLLLESMLISFQTIQASYDSYLCIKDNMQKQGR